MTELVQIERLGNLAVVSMNKPPYNLIDGALLSALVAGLEEAVDSGARAVVLNGSQKHFSGGAEVALFTRGGTRDVTKDRPEVGVVDFLKFMRELPVPTVASLHGAVLGGGLELALSCDAIIAAKSARIGAIEVTLGLMPIMGAVQRLVERAGSVRAKEMAMLGRRHDPETLAAWNVINLVVEERELYSVSINYAQQLANGPTVALRAIKRLANEAENNGVAAADELMPDLVREVMASEDLKLGLAAFQSTGPGTAVFRGE
jgi:enoyl-CoA hydratase/carnithine racemase